MAQEFAGLPPPATWPGPTAPGHGPPPARTSKWVPITIGVIWVLTFVTLALLRAYWVLGSSERLGAVCTADGGVRAPGLVLLLLPVGLFVSAAVVAGMHTRTRGWVWVLVCAIVATLVVLLAGLVFLWIRLMLTCSYSPGRD